MLKKWIAWMAPVHPTGLSIGLLTLRLGAGLTMLSHGWGKLTNFSKMSGSFPDPLGLGSSTMSLALATFAEFGCSILIVLGLATRLAAIPLVTTMAVAFFIIHADDPWQVKEMAFVYLVVFGSLAIIGAGRFSLDAILSRKV